ncbi:MAG: hypothetical protein CMJ48_13190 [Planctomycetaceae bacterium]|nr:hypothetical protein [Planctomycetaceae bacterium]
MGAVYKALHTKLDKLVALKILPADRMQDAKAVARFEREMKAVGKLDDPHIVRATDAGKVDGTHFLVMEYVDGIDLSRLLKQRGPFAIPDACEIVRQGGAEMMAVAITVTNMTAMHTPMVFSNSRKPPRRTSVTATTL